MATGAREWKQANRKEVTLPSGRVAVIRKLTSEFLLTMQEINDDLLKLGLGNRLDAEGKPLLDKDGKPRKIIP